MTRINRVTTKSGDKGKTSLASGLRVDKSDYSIGALGSVDELSAFLGLLRMLMGISPLERGIAPLLNGEFLVSMRYNAREL